jgi:hypothetical protein
MDGLSSFLESSTPDGVPADGVPADACCFAINSGEVMIDMQAHQPSAFGKTVRETKRLLLDISDCSIVMQRGLFELVAGDNSGGKLPLLTDFKEVSAGEEAFVTLVPANK